MHLFMCLTVKRAAHDLFESISASNNENIRQKLSWIPTEQNGINHHISASYLPQRNDFPCMK